MKTYEIVHIVDSFATGGLERQIFNMVAYGYMDAYVICLSKKGYFGDHLEKLGKQVIYLTSSSVLGRLYEINKIFKQFPAEIIHAHNQKAYFYGCILGRIHANVHVLLSLHGESFVVGKLSSFISGLFAKNDMIIAVSEKIKIKALESFGGDEKRIFIVANGAPFIPKSLKPEPVKDLLTIGAVGRLEKVKNYALLISAFAKLAEDHAHIRLLIVGDGSLRQNLETQAAELGLGNRVTFAGMQQEVGSFLDAMDVFAISSDSEGLPLALLEAASHSIPIVSTAVGAIPGILTHGTSVMLSPPGVEDAFVDNLRQCIDDAELRANLASNAYDSLEASYSIDASVKMHAHIYGLLRQR